jgi:hypothetical protein
MSRFTVGDIVLVCGNTSGHKYKMAQDILIVQVFNAGHDNEHYFTHAVCDPLDTWWVEWCDLQPNSAAPTPSKRIGFR